VPLPLEKRIDLKASLGTRLSFFSDEQLARLVRPIALRHPAWGGHGVATVAGTKVFVKRIPITEIELSSPYSTKNHYQLPTYYSYGIGSAGCGAWREIASVNQASNWVLANTCPSFPLLYHHRIIRRGGRRARIRPEEYDGYIEYWNSSARIRKFMESRHLATHEAVLFLEHFPHTLHPWFAANLSSASHVFSKMQALTDFLRSQCVVHFDCHHRNILTDGESLYLTDFGLASNTDFDLTTREQSFLAGNTFSDIGTFVFRCREYVIEAYRGRTKSDKTKIRKLLGVEEKTHPLILEGLLVQNLDELRESGLLPLDENLARQMAIWKDVSTLMSVFYRGLIFDNQKKTQLDNDQLEKLVLAARSN